jgi:hypothetical protein
MEKEQHKGKIGLEGMKKKNIYSVPDGYFDKLPYSIQEKITAHKKPWPESLQLSPVKYTLGGIAALVLAIFIYLIIPKEQQQIAKKDLIEKDSIIKQTENNNQEVLPAAPHNNNTVAVEKPKILNDSSDKNTVITNEKLGSPESYLAELSSEDIQEYLDLNDQEDFQTEEFLQD